MKIKKHREEKLNRRFNGFERLPKSIFRLLTGENPLNAVEFTCYIFIYSNLVEFSVSRSIELGTYDFTNKEIADVLKWSESRVSRIITALKKKGYIVINKYDLPELVGYKVIKAYLSEYSKTYNRTAPHKTYIPFNEIIDHCRSNCLDLTYAESLAVLQEIDMGIFLKDLGTTVNFEEDCPP